MRNFGQLVGDTAKQLRDTSTRIPTGFPSMDTVLGGGLRRKSFDLLLARPEVGKTSIAIAIAVNAVRNGFPAMIASLEMSAEEVTIRVLSNFLAMPVSLVEEMLKSPQPDSALLMAIRDLKDLNIQDGTKPDWNTLRGWVEAQNPTPKLVVLDHLRLMKRYGYPKGEAERVQQLSEDAKVFAKETDVALLTLHHVGRGEADNKNHGHAPLTMEDGFYGGEMDGDRVFGLYGPERDPSLTPEVRQTVKGKRVLQLLKNRHGESSYEGVLLDWRRPTMVFEEADLTQVTYLGQSDNGPRHYPGNSNDNQRQLLPATSV